MLGFPATPIGVAEVHVREGAPAPRNDSLGWQDGA
jgi:hypothetical protein